MLRVGNRNKRHSTAPATPASPTKGKRVTQAMAGLATVAAVTSLSGLAPSLAGASVTQTSHFVVQGTAASASGDSMYINNGATNSQPNDLLFVTPNWNATGLCGCVYNSPPIGVWYNNSSHKWAVFEENTSAMPAGASFNVLAVPTSSSSAFVQTSSSSNDAGDYTIINSPLTNGQPNAQLQVTQNWNPGGHGGTYNNHNVGVWYDSAIAKWAIFNEDRATMMTGRSFNVLVGSAPSNGGYGVVAKASSGNSSGDTLYVNNFISNGNPNAVVFDTPNWNPGGSGGTYDPAASGVWYTGSGIGVFNQDRSTMTAGSAFNLLVFSG